ncbi:MAG: 6,7-dimethyl-8-ribityllumazine synthase [Sterolibacterium sp.]|nr:6,7-dimethyl-8-ribityllumazine synthase [Sterolibacterium sp.]MBP9798978.1 6,7-dimethyl-8-ribityllumazine synthase [Sterolibacterium sp.]
MSFSGKVREIEPGLSGTGRRIAIVSARFNPDICAGLYSACVAELNRLGVADSDITSFSVPGALELPLALQALAQTGRYDALVAIGCVIRGETYHFEIVANESARGILEVQLKTGLPIANVVLTTEDDDQALARMSIKGTEAAQAAIEMANLLQAIR